MSEIQVTIGEVGGAMADAIAFLEQDDIHGVTQTLIVTKKQLAEIGWFITHPNSKRFRTTDKTLGTVTVRYSKADGQYTIEQGELKLFGSRDGDQLGFVGFAPLGSAV